MHEKSIAPTTTTTDKPIAPSTEFRKANHRSSKEKTMATSATDNKIKVAVILRRNYGNLSYMDVDRMVGLIDDWHAIHYPDGKVGMAVKVGILGWFSIRESIDEI